MPITAETLSTWIAAIEEGYVTPRAWAPWAEREIAAASRVQPWLADLFAADTPDAARAALAGGLATVPRAPGDFSLDSLRIGFLWLLYEREDIDASDALERAGSIAEREAFHGLLDELAGDGPAEPAALSLNQRIAALFAPHAALARALLPHLA